MYQTACLTLMLKKTATKYDYIFPLCILVLNASKSKNDMPPTTPHLPPLLPHLPLCRQMINGGGCGVFFIVMPSFCGWNEGSFPRIGKSDFMKIVVDLCFIPRLEWSAVHWIWLNKAGVRVRCVLNIYVLNEHYFHSLLSCVYHVYSLLYWSWCYYYSLLCNLYYTLWQNYMNIVIKS